MNTDVSALNDTYFHVNMRIINKLNETELHSYVFYEIAKAVKAKLFFITFILLEKLSNYQTFIIVEFSKIAFKRAFFHFAFKLYLSGYERKNYVNRSIHKKLLHFLMVNSFHIFCGMRKFSFKPSVAFLKSKKCHF